MYGVPVLIFVGIVVLLIVANFFAERALKSRPEFRSRTYACLRGLGYAYLTSAVLGIFIGGFYGALCFPLFLLIAILRAWKATKVAS